MMKNTTHLLPLHQTIYPRFRQYRLNLTAIAPSVPVASVTNANVPCITYMRPAGEALTIERLMGSGLTQSGTVDLSRHPVIELREYRGGVVLELILTPSAWWYQQNLIGKLSIERQLDAFQRLIGRMSDHMCVGFWQGIQLDEAHLTPRHLKNPQIFRQWMSTYCDARDFFRVGAWYDAPVDANLLFDDLQALYGLYDFVSWSSNNDFRAFYRNQTASA